LKVARKLPAAATIIYPAPLGPVTEEDRTQIVERARSLAGLELKDIISRLAAAGAFSAAEEEELVSSGEALAAESMISYCVTGMSRNWQVSRAYRASQRPAEEVPSAPPCPALGLPGAALEGPHMTSSNSPGSSLSQATHKLQEKAISSMVHLGLRGPAAKVAGAAAAMTVEGYALYQDIRHHGEKLETNSINADQFTERVCESGVTSSGRVFGSMAGAAIGQAAIPIPILGAVVGGVLGGTCGGLQANSLIRGAWRLSGGKAKGGEDLVRVVEHGRSADGPMFAASATLKISVPALPQQQQQQQPYRNPVHQACTGDEEDLL